MNDIFDNMDAEALDWLSSALYHAAHSEDSSYVDPDYVDTQTQVIWALDQFAQRVEAAYRDRVKS